jgi:hypothetical protein
VLVVMSFDCFSRSIDQLEADNLESTGFDSASDFTDQISLDAAWLDKY